MHDTHFRPFLRLLSYLKPFRKDYLLAGMYSICNKLFDIAPEILIGVAVDCVVRQQHSWLAHLGLEALQKQIIWLGIITLIIWCLESLFEYLHSVKWRTLAQEIQHAFRMDAYEHVQNFEMSVFEEQKTGNLVSILNDDINQLERFFEYDINKIIQILFSSLAIGAIFFILAPEIAMYAFIPIPFIIYGAFYFQSKLRPKFLGVRQKAGLLGTRLAANVLGIFTIKSFGAEANEKRLIKQASLSYLEENRNVIKLSSLVTPVTRMGIAAGFIVTLVYGGLLTVDNHISIGVYSILIFLTQRLLWPMTYLAEITVSYQRAMAATTRVIDLLNLPSSPPHEGNKHLNRPIKGQIDIHHLRFAYKDRHQVFSNLSLSIPAGATIGLVGTTGAGKSTLIKLLLRFYEPLSGEILLDGQDIKEVPASEIRQAVGVVSQDVFLFDGTIKDNISYACADATNKDIIHAAKLAEAHDFIMGLPKGYDTVIGERGQKLSGGQRQRIAIARALIRNPAILIFDEATSAVDNETEMAIQKSLQHISVGRTTIIVAHRLSTIRSAHKIFVMKEGQIVEEGNHEELLAQDQIYASLWKLQTGQKGVHEELL